MPAYTTTYNTLAAELGTYCEDDTSEYQTELPNIINRAVDMVAALLKLELFTSFDTFDFTDATSTYARPSGEMIEGFFFADGSGFVERRSGDFVMLMRGQFGPPKYFAELDVDRIVVAPTPDDDTPAYVKVLKKPAKLDGTTQTNWITDHAADLLLLAALVESEQFLLAPERLGEFKQSLANLVAIRGDELREMARASAPVPTSAPPAEAA